MSGGGLPWPVEVAECLAALAAMVAIAYVSRWVRQVMDRRFPKRSPVAAETGARPPETATVYVEGPLTIRPREGL